MLKYIGLVLVIAIAALLLYATTRPGTLRIERTATMQAPPEKIFTLVDDFHNWQAWSPWEKLDPAMKKTYSGPSSGEGAIYEWDGNSKAGKGRMEILHDANPSNVAIQLDFITPFEGHYITELTVVPSGNATTVTWTMTGPSPYTQKLIGIFLGMDKMVGGDFETGLANLKTLAEK